MLTKTEHSSNESLDSVNSVKYLLIFDALWLLHCFIYMFLPFKLPKDAFKHTFTYSNGHGMLLGEAHYYCGYIGYCVNNNITISVIIITAVIILMYAAYKYCSKTITVLILTAIWLFSTIATYLAIYEMILLYNTFIGN